MVHSTRQHDLDSASIFCTLSGMVFLLVKSIVSPPKSDTLILCLRHYTELQLRLVPAKSLRRTLQAYMAKLRLYSAHPLSGDRGLRRSTCKAGFKKNTSGTQWSSTDSHQNVLSENTYCEGRLRFSEGATLRLLQGIQCAFKQFPQPLPSVAAARDVG